jgi:hypothetical protein
MPEAEGSIPSAAGSGAGPFPIDFPTEEGRKEREKLQKPRVIDLQKA